MSAIDTTGARGGAWPVLAVVLAVVPAGCGGGGEDDDDGGVPSDAGPLADADPLAPDADLPDAAIPREVIMETQALLPGEIVEAIFTGGPDDFAIIHLEAPVAELDWNIHGHDDGGTQTVYEELNRMTVDYRFTPPSETMWWLLLRNSGPTAMDVELRVELHGDLTWAWQ